MSSKKGNYYKRRTKVWFEKLGYTVDYLEKQMRIFARGQVIFIKKDVFAADGLAMNHEEIIFWNSKFNKSHIAQGIKDFLKYPYPKKCKNIKKWLVVWEYRAQHPIIIDVDDVKHVKKGGVV